MVIKVVFHACDIGQINDFFAVALWIAVAIASK